MPELPEVEVARRNLERWGRGRRIEGVEVPDPGAVRARPGSRPSDAWREGVAFLRRMEGHALGPVLRHGKRLGLQAGDVGVVVHLGMTGRWSRAGEPPRWARAGLRLDRGGTLWFVDPRRFGFLMPTERRDLERALRDGLGPDALEEALDGPGLAERVGGRQPIKVALMEQARIAGIGNIQAVEALFRAGIHPARPASSLSPEDWARLAASIPDALREGIAVTEGEEVTYLSDGAHVDNPFAVYGREGEPCRRCGTPIRRAVLGGRSTYWCPRCQPAA